MSTSSRARPPGFKLDMIQLVLSSTPQTDLDVDVHPIEYTQLWTVDGKDGAQRELVVDRESGRLIGSVAAFHR